MIPPLFRYVIVSNDADNLKNEVNSVKANVDIFEISVSLIDKLTPIQIDEIFLKKPLLVKVSSKITPVMLSNYATYTISLPVSSIVGNILGQVIEADLTKYIIDEAKNVLSDTINKGVSSILVTQEMLENTVFSTALKNAVADKNVSVSVQLNTFDETTINNAVTDGATTIIFQYISAEASSSINKLNDTIKRYNKPIDDIDNIVLDLYKLQSTYCNSKYCPILKRIKEIPRINFRPKITTYLKNKLDYIKTYVETIRLYPITENTPKPIERTYIEHEMAIMSKANMVENYRIRIMNTTAGTVATLEAALKVDDAAAAANIKDLRSLLDTAMETDHFVLQNIKHVCDNLLDMYKNLTKDYYSYYKEYIDLKAEVAREESLIQKELDVIYSDILNDTNSRFTSYNGIITTIRAAATSAIKVRDTL